MKKILLLLTLFYMKDMQHADAQSPIRYDNPKAQILFGVEIPAGSTYFYTSGIVPDVLNDQAPAGSRERYGDTYTQSLGVMKKIEGILKNAGLTLQDVVFLRIYLVPDKHAGNKTDFDGWFKAYPQYFMNEANPNKVARSTIGVNALANPDLLVEIEAVAVRPAK